MGTETDMAFDILASSLSEQAGPRTAQAHNANLTGQLDPVPDVPAIAPADNMRQDTGEPEINPETDINVRTGEQEPEIELDGARTKRDLRLNMARRLKYIFENDETLTIEQKIKLANSIEKLTSGRKMRQPSRDKKQTGIFES